MNSTNKDEELFLEFEEVADFLDKEQTLTTYTMSFLNAQREVALQVQGLQQRLCYILSFYERETRRAWSYPAQINYEGGWRIEIRKVRGIFIPVISYYDIPVVPDSTKLLLGGELYFLKNNKLNLPQCAEIIAILQALQFDELRLILFHATQT